MENSKKRVKGLFGIVLCLCMLWGSVMTAYAATNYDVNYMLNPPIKLGSGKILYAGDTITQATGISGGFQIVYQNANGDTIGTSGLADGSTDHPQMTVNTVMEGYDAWKVLSDTASFLSESGNLFYKIIVTPYKSGQGPGTPTDANTGSTTVTGQNGTKEQSTKYVDRDTYKSDYPVGEVVCYDSPDMKKAIDFKVHAAEKRSVDNQQLLTNSYMSALGKAGAGIVLTKDIFPYRDLTLNEKGSKQILHWKNTGITPGTNVYAVCYNQTDGAYLISGTVNKDKVAIFDQFSVREASTVSIVIPQ